MDRLPAKVAVCSLLENARTSSGKHPAFSVINTKRYFPTNKATRMWKLLLPSVQYWVWKRTKLYSYCPHLPLLRALYRGLCVFIGAFARLRKVTNSFMSVRLSVRPSVYMEQLDSHWTDFYKIWYLSFLKILRKNQILLQSGKTFYRTTFPHLWQYLAKVFLEWEMFEIKVVEKM